MNFYEAAAPLVCLGFRIFPVVPRGKKPAIRDFPTRATTDITQLKGYDRYNVGISTNGYIAIDVDNKDGRNGSETILALELDGRDFPLTYTQTTPSGGLHLVYRTARNIGNGVNSLGPGVDIRGTGGYIVGAGSEIDGKQYSSNGLEVAQAPSWLEDILSEVSVRAEAPAAAVDSDMAASRASEYLAIAPISVSGAGGNATAYNVIAKLRDFGVDAAAAKDLLAPWNERCQPPWSEAELEKSIENVYRYAKNAQACDSPEAVFEPAAAEDPIEALNKEYAFIIEDGGHHVLWETKDIDGNFKLRRLPETTFHKANASKVIYYDGKGEPLTKAWMNSPRRRSYRGYCFRPGLATPDDYYNLFHGFAIEPHSPASPALAAQCERALDAFYSHLRDNICAGDSALFDWTMNYFAHLFQRPWEKPLVALVFRGRKGVGKNAAIRSIAALLGRHSLLASNRRYLLSNFNGHLENLLLFILDEAFWSGDKEAEGVLKDLITGDTHAIERKGQETYTVPNLCRIAIIGNESWVVPASEDERRYAVFTVGEGRKQDTRFFHNMRIGMEAGGYSLLMRDLLNYKMDPMRVNTPPQTKGLYSQKMESRHPVYMWWHESLTEGKLLGTLYPSWPAEVGSGDLRDAMSEYYSMTKRKAQVPTQWSITQKLQDCCPQMERIKTSLEGRPYGYALPPLEQAREAWEAFIGYKEQW